MALLTQEQMLAPQNSSIAIIGPPRTGKTESLASFWKYAERTKQPNDAIEIFDMDDDGSVSLIRKAKELGKSDLLRVHRFRRRAGQKIEMFLNDGLAPARYDEIWKEFADELNSLYDQIDSITGQWKNPVHAPGLIAIDSMTSLQEDIWDFVLKQTKTEAGIASNRLGFDQWTNLHAKTMDVVKAAKGFPCHCAFTFHLDYQVEDAGQVPKIIPDPRGGPARQVMEPIFLEGNVYRHVPAMMGQKLTFIILKDFGIAVESCFQNGKYQWKVVPDKRSQSIGSRAHAAFKDSHIDQNLDLVL